jgi:hypothetical protein
MKKLLLAFLFFGVIGTAYAFDGHWSSDWNDIGWSHYDDSDNHHCSHGW